MRAVRLALAAALTLSLAACATRAPYPTAPPPRNAPRPAPPPPAPEPGPPAPSPVTAPPSAPPSAPTPGVRLPLAVLPGWAEEDHLAALSAFRVGCPLDAALAGPCRAAGELRAPDAASARRFFEDNFRAEPVGDAFGLLTAYFAPEYPARAAPDAEFSAPVRPKPIDLVPGAPYAERIEIDARPAENALAWMRPEDLFFLQIQGSGTLVMPDGRRLKAAYAAHNSRPFIGIAAPMRELGLLADANTSGEAIRSWLAENRGDRADGIMRLNPRYVFFTLGPDDGKDPAGAANLPLPAGHAIAIDQAFHRMGQAYWIDAAAPVLNGAFPTYRRLVMALDTGGAIKGEVRADLYLGRGSAAGVEAGRVRHSLRMYRLVPAEP